MYPGGKGKSYQQLINLMPVHKTYIEPYLGAGAVLKNKKPAQTNIGNDLDVACTDELKHLHYAAFFNEDALSLLKEQTLCIETLIYCDPPYVKETRRKQKIYRFEYSDAQHEALLRFLLKQNCMVMISGYQSDLYQDYLNGWNFYSFSSQTLNGIRQECVWFNYDKPNALHDSRFVGQNFRERQTIKRRQSRLKRKFQEMDPVERSAFMDWLNTEFPLQGEQQI
jgi:DNA adenine methylase